jgi:hypothetical protein
MEKKKGSKKKDDVIERDDAIEVLFVGENDYLVIETFVNRPLTMEEIGSVKPEAFPTLVNNILFKVVKVPREWSLHADNKKISQFFDRCTCPIFVINLDTCDQPSKLDPSKNELTVAFEVLKHFSNLDAMFGKTFCVVFLESKNATKDQLSAMAAFTDGEANLEKLRAYAESIVKQTSSFRIMIKTLSTNLQNAREEVFAAIRDIILLGAIALI